jgi:hypothetical protein
MLCTSGTPEPRIVPARFYALITWSKRTSDRYLARQVSVRFSQLEELLDLARDLRPIARNMTVSLLDNRSGDSIDWSWQRKGPVSR